MVADDSPRVERPDMVGYGVPADPDGLLPWKWAQERLVSNRNYWVVTVSAVGRPHALPVWGVWQGESNRFRFSCAPSAHKLRNLAANPRCVVTTGDTVEVVSVEGEARRIDPDDPTEAELVDRMIADYLVKYYPRPEQHPEMAAFLRRNAVVEVVPDRAFGLIERPDEFARCATRWRWSRSGRRQH